MSNIPEARERLLKIADEIDWLNGKLGDEVRGIVRDLMVRPTAIRKARAQSTPMTDELRDELRSYARRNPTKTYASIAHHFDVNPGRVSEALRGAA
jgi:hypothetical protein